MTVVQALILGVVQGVTEFLPISSSGFLILVPEMFGWEVQPLGFDVAVHVATLAAVVAALWSDIREVFRRSDMVRWLLLATVPAVIAGGLLEVLSVDFRTGNVVAWSFIIWGLVLYVVDRYARGSLATIEAVGMKRALLIGLAQMIALIPGTSRSGITITAGLGLGLNRETAARFSFLLSIPLIVIAGGLKTVQFVRGDEDVAIAALLAGFVAAFVTAHLAIKVLLKFLQSNSYAELAIFRVIIGVFLLMM